MSDFNSTTQFSDDQLLAITQNHRLEFLKTLLLDNQYPDDTKEQTILLTTLADIDRTALGNKRIGAKEKQSATDRLVAETIHQLIHKLDDMNPFESTETARSLNPNTLPDPKPVPGEMEQGIPKDNYDDFIKRIENP